MPNLFRIPLYEWNPHAAPLFLCAVLMIALGMFTLWKTSFSIIGRRFLYIACAVTVWLVGTAMGYLSRTPDVAIMWFRIDNVGVAFISPAVYAFCFALLGRPNPRRTQILFLLATAMGIWTIQTNQIMVSAVRHSWGFYPTRDLRSLPFFIFFFTLMGLAFMEMWHASSSADRRVRSQAKYMLAAFGVAYVGSVDYVPTYQIRPFGIDIYPFGYIFITLYVSIIAFAIMKRGFMDLRLILRDSTTHIITAASIAIVTILVSFPLINVAPYAALVLQAIVGTLLMAFAYDPIRKALQPAIDRVMFANQFGYLEELAQLPNDMLEFTNLRELLKFLVTRLVEAGKLEHAAIYMYDPPQQSYVQAIQYQNPDKSRNVDSINPQWCIGQDAALARFLKSDNRLWMKEDLAEANDSSKSLALQELIDLAAGATFGVMRDKELVGIIVLGEKVTRQRFNQNDIKILKALKLRLENFLLQAMVTTQESLNMVKDSHDMKNDVNALSGRLSMKRFKLRTMEKTISARVQELEQAIQSKTVDENTILKELSAIKAAVAGTSQEQQALLPIEEDALERLRNKLQNWSVYGRLIAGGFQGSQRIEAIDATAVARICIERWRPAAERKAVTLSLELDEGLKVMGERSLFEQILDNLVDNAIKATDHGSVTLSCRRTGQQIVIQVQDTGCGIPDEHQAQIFKKPFYQGKGRESLEKSTGVGLVLVGQYAKSLNGEVAVESQEGKGTRFIVRLPAAETSEKAA